MTASHVSRLFLSVLNAVGGVWSFCLAKLNWRQANTNLDSVLFPSPNLHVIFDSALAVLTRAVKEILCFQQPLSLLWQIQEVHIGDCQLLAFCNLTQSTQLDPGDENHSQTRAEMWKHMLCDWVCDGEILFHSVAFSPVEGLILQLSEILVSVGLFHTALKWQNISRISGSFSLICCKVSFNFRLLA